MSKNYKKKVNTLLSLVLSLAMVVTPLVNGIPVQADPGNGGGGH